LRPTALLSETAVGSYIAGLPVLKKPLISGFRPFEALKPFVRATFGPYLLTISRFINKTGLFCAETLDKLGL